MIRTSELRRRAEHRLDRQSQAPALQSVAAEQLQQVPLGQELRRRAEHHLDRGKGASPI